MIKKIFQFSNSSSTFYFDASFDHLEKLTSKDNTVIITDENVFAEKSKEI